MAAGKLLVEFRSIGNGIGQIEGGVQGALITNSFVRERQSKGLQSIETFMIWETQHPEKRTAWE